MIKSEEKEKQKNSLPKKTVTTKQISAMGNRAQKKTVEIKLIFEIALENLKSERKRKSRFKETNLPVTTNGIFDEMIQEFFNKPENQKYLRQAEEELAEN